MLLRRPTSVSCFATLLLLAVAACRPTVVSASDHFQAVSAEELAMKSEPLAPGAPAIILFRQVDTDDNSRPHQFNYVRIKILTEEGRKYADAEIPFWKDIAEVNDLKARTIRPNGSIVNYEGKAFEKTIVKARGLKYLAKTFTLPDVQVGGIVEYYWTYNYNHFFDSRWILSEELFTRTARFSLRNRDGWSLRWTWQRLPPGTTEPKDEHGVIRLEVHNIPAFQTEDFMPPVNELKSRVDFVYSRAPIDKDTDTFWKKQGQELNDWLEAFTNKHKAMQQAVAQIVSPEDSPEVKLRKIYVRVQQLRNKSYEERKTQQEEKRDNEKDIKNVEDIWKRGYGSGGEVPWLYLALVRAAGLEAYGVWVSDRQYYFFDPKQKDREALNATLVLVKLNGKDIYCDPGAKFAPFGLLPWYETGVYGLRLDKNGGSWVKTPVPESSASRVERKADLKLSDTGDLQGRLTITFTGLEAMQRREDERNEDEAERKKYLEYEVKEYIPAPIEVELTNRPDWSNPDAPFVAEFSVKVPGWGSGAGRRVLIPVGLFSGTEKHLFDHAGRVHPIYMEFPFQKVDTVTIDLPAGWQVSSLPPAVRQDGHIITYSMKVESEKGRVQMTRGLDVNILLVQTEYYTALRNFFQQVRMGDEQQVVLQPGIAPASK